MYPGGRVNPRQMKAMMKRMGISQEDIDDVEEIIIRTRTQEYIFNEAVDGFCQVLPGWWGSCSDRYLDYTGTATGMIVDGNISTVFNGYVRLYGAQSAQCTGEHRLDFTRVVPTPPTSR